MRILVVEDDPDLNRQTGPPRLAMAGYVVDKALDGEEGALPRLHDRTPMNAVVLDLGLPILEGGECSGEMAPRRQTMPVLILTARDRWSDKVAGFECWCRGLRGQPFQMEGSAGPHAGPFAP
jgi:two-component system OmpR family response regulator